MTCPRSPDPSEFDGTYGTTEIVPISAFVILLLLNELSPYIFLDLSAVLYA